MRTVEDGTGREYLLIKRSGDEWLVRDPETGRESYRSPQALTVIDDTGPLRTAAAAIPENVRTVFVAVPTARALGLLVEIDRDGPLSVRSMLERYEFCESDLHGRLAEFRAAGLIAEHRVAGERGYETTETAARALETLTELERA